ncbi:MAG: hypothetical protein JXA89_18115 [Anaerolineae bacterium]|nr:hypothetical protein [Anaerolineae bacterium]
MADLSELTELDVQQWCGEASFERGRAYYQRGHILYPRRQGDTIKGRCLGSMDRPYELVIHLGPEGIVSGACSCPVGHGGHCKHAAALLLTWIHEPETFAQVEVLEEALEGRSKSELIVLIRRMIERYPDLEMLVELPTASGQQPVDTETVRKQANAAFHSIEYGDWGGVYGIVQALSALVDLGDDYAVQQNWRNAAAVYRPVIEVVLEQYGTVEDEGELAGVVNTCVSGLGQCLEMVTDVTFRETLLRVLFGVYRWDVEFGGIDMGYEATDFILNEGTSEEKELVAQWVREAIPQSDDWSSEFHRQVFGRFLLELEAEHLDDEGYLHICRETSRWSELVDRLLALGRVNEAVEVARIVSDYELLSLANLFVAHNEGKLARQMVGERSRMSDDSRLVAWLKDDAQKRGDPLAALEYAQTLFWQRPDAPAYHEVRELAQPVGQWASLRASILEQLTAQGKFELLTNIYVDEGRVDDALVSLAQQMCKSRWGWVRSSLTIRVAKAAESARPREAIRLYVTHAQQLIDARGRGNYTEAAGYLKRVRELYHTLGKQETWQQFIADLRSRERRLRALKEELNRAGL